MGLNNATSRDPHIILQLVAMTVPPVAGESSKIKPKYRGPLLIMKSLPNVTYQVASISMGNRRIYSTTAHVSQLKQWKLVKEDDVKTIDENKGDTKKTREETGEIDDGRWRTIPRRFQRRPAYLEDYQVPFNTKTY